MIISEPRNVFLGISQRTWFGTERGVISETLKISTSACTLSIVRRHHFDSEFRDDLAAIPAILSVSRSGKIVRSGRIYQVARRDNARKRHVSKFGPIFGIQACRDISGAPGHRLIINDPISDADSTVLCGHSLACFMSDGSVIGDPANSRIGSLCNEFICDPLWKVKGGDL
jgi:hypothetical protein